MSKVLDVDGRSLQEGDEVRLLDFSSCEASCRSLGRERLEFVGSTLKINRFDRDTVNIPGRGEVRLSLVDLDTEDKPFSFWPAKFCRLVKANALGELVMRYREADV